MPFRSVTYSIAGDGDDDDDAAISLSVWPCADFPCLRARVWLCVYALACVPCCVYVCLR